VKWQAQSTPNMPLILDEYIISTYRCRMTRSVIMDRVSLCSVGSCDLPVVTVRLCDCEGDGLSPSDILK